MALVGNTVEQRVWNYLISNGLNKYGAAGLMGNLYAESGMIFNRVEILCLKRLKENGKIYTDETYTAAVDSGAISRAEFLNPLPNRQYGYGLWQLTTPGRKAGLYDLAKKRNTSIADEQTQLDYLMQELSASYKSTLSVLKSATSVKAASDVVLTKFECPADTSSSVKTLRAKYGQTYYNKYASIQNNITTGGDSMKVVIQAKTENGKTKISNSGHDERNKYSGGSAGDNTGGEWQVISWYNRPWNCVLRHPDENVRILLAYLAEQAALNNKIGYDQYQRDTYWSQLQKVGYDPSKITTACESDCSAGVIANTKAVGYLLNIESLKHIGATYTGNMRSSYKTAGFQVLTDSKYLTSSAYLLPGDILLNDSAHTATNLTPGTKVSASTSGTVTTSSTKSKDYLSVGDAGNDVKAMQTMLIACGYSCGSAGADGDFGSGTFAALKSFQKENGLTVDGLYGSASKAKLTALYDKKTNTSTSTASSNSNKLNEVPKWTGVVTADKLNVRTWAGSENSTCSFSPLKRNTKVGVCDSVKDKDGNEWYFVKYNEKFGFAKSDYIGKQAQENSEKIVGTAQYKDAKIAGTYKATTNLNLRYVAGKISEDNVVCIIPSSEKVQCYGYYNLVNNTKWYLVAYGSNTGYVSSEYLRK